MEDKERAFESVNIGMASVETGAQRYVRDHHTRAPLVALWRVNLTALSQRYNLYFVASAHQIQVFEPEFPFQSLGNVPRLTIQPQLENERAGGYISPQHPHCINHIVVGDLGNQEILLLSTDSGNVAAYYTSSILNAIRNRPYRFSAEAQADYVGLRPFFTQWVHESAWGLAIHSNGRMIAVSANTPKSTKASDKSSKITVFAFALSVNDAGDGKEDGEMGTDAAGVSNWHLWTSVTDDISVDTPRRNRNYKIILAGEDGHVNNVPCVTFVNGAQDQEGSWLLSTDIHGEVKMWQIWQGKCLKTWSFVNRGTLGADAWMRGWEAGWIVAALDINAFRPAQTNDAFIGYHRAPRNPGYEGQGESFNLTNIVRHHVPSNDAHHPDTVEFNNDDSQPEEDVLFEDLSESEATADEEETIRVRKILEDLAATTSTFQSSSTTEHYPPSETTSAHMAVTRAAPPIEGDDGVEDDDEIYLETSEEEEDDELDVQFHSDFSDDEMSDGDDNDGSNSSLISTTSISSYNPRDSQDYDSAPNRASTKLDRHSSKRAVRDHAGANQSVIVNVPDVPFIHCSTSHLRLFGGTETRTPHVFCANMLRQELLAHMEGWPLANMDRLNMIEQIPELGIVIVASQVGRCAVCTLTKRKRDGILGLRVDWVLPTRKEEKAGVRPIQHPLHGIAVSPVQGRLLEDVKPISEEDTEEHWAKDRTINGTPTTFDNARVDTAAQHRQRIVNSHTSSAPDGPYSSDDESRLFGQSQKPRIGSSKAPCVLTLPHRWSKKQVSEDWRSTEPSRRYRLMMTYADMTVLSYELSRGVEKEDTRVRVRK